MAQARAVGIPASPASKLPDVGTTIFAVMSELAAAEGALNLSQGFPDFDGPPELLERVRHHLEHGHNQYAPMMGVPALREAIAAKVESLYGQAVDPATEVTVTSGATEALFCAIAAMVRPGDEVILFDPAYDSYEPAVRLQGGRTRRLALKAPEFRPDWDQVADALNDRTRLIVINTPHNPTGSVWLAEDMAALAEVVRGREIYLLGDEVYEHIIFDGLAHQSLARYPELYARSFVVSSFGKTYHTTGWKIGYCTAPPALTRELRRIHQYVCYTSNTPVQMGLADFLASNPSFHDELGTFYQHKRDLLQRLLEPSRFRVLPCRGTYFQMLDYGDISNARDDELARQWTVEHKLATIPLSPFYDEAPQQSLLRLCFAKDDATLSRAAELLCRL